MPGRQRTSGPLLESPAPPLLFTPCNRIELLGAVKAKTSSTPLLCGSDVSVPFNDLCSCRGILRLLLAKVTAQIGLLSGFCD